MKAQLQGWASRRALVRVESSAAARLNAAGLLGSERRRMAEMRRR